MAMALMSEAKKGISALQVSRHIGVAYKTAWYLCHRIRKAMQELEPSPLGGQGKVVEIDETWLGGKKLRKGVKAGRENKIATLGIAERNGRVHLQRISNVKAETIKPILEAKLNSETDKVVTDSHATYRWLLPAEKHEITSHKDDLREFGETQTKTVEGAFSLFKRGVVGSYHHLSEDHLDSYLGEFCWRYNRRKMQPFIFQTILTELTQKKPLTYKKLTREVF
jgi:transposase-like protein